jgi:nicotinamidase-related amidase
MTDAILPRRGDTSLLVVDLQDVLCTSIGDAADAALRQTSVLVEVAATFGWPTVFTEQNPAKLGRTRDLLRARLEQLGAPCFDKLEFSCARNAAFAAEAMPRLRNHVVVCGIEAHICVLQTVADLQNRGFQCFVPEDAVASRAESNRTNGLALCQRAGATIVNTESLLFHALEKAGTDTFRRLAPLIR